MTLFCFMNCFFCIDVCIVSSISSIKVYAQERSWYYLVPISIPVNSEIYKDHLRQTDSANQANVLCITLCIARRIFVRNHVHLGFLWIVDVELCKCQQVLFTCNIQNIEMHSVP